MRAKSDSRRASTRSRKPTPARCTAGPITATVHAGVAVQVAGQVRPERPADRPARSSDPTRTAVPSSFLRRFIRRGLHAPLLSNCSGVPMKLALSLLVVLPAVLLAQNPTDA